MNELKQKLLGLGVFVTNKYLDRYCLLVENNKQTKKEKFKTQQHHIIPKAFYKLTNCTVDNTKKNLINLLYKDHALAHYYLALCTEGELKLANILAFNFCLNNKNYSKLPEYLNEKQLLNDLDNLQQLYEDFTQLQLSMQYVTKDGKTIKVSKDSIPKYLAAGWSVGNGQKHKPRATNPPTVAVICIETQETFNSIKDASAKYKGNILQCLRSDYTRVAAGYHWAKVQDIDRQTALAEYVGKPPIMSAVNGKRCRCIETGVCYESASTASRETGIKGIKNCCNGHCRSAGGYQWEYA